MKILITGADSYIGSAAEEKLSSSGHEVAVLDMRGDWREFDFSGYQAVFHVAGIAHLGRKASTEDYYRVNRDLAIETARKAKDSGVGLFVFMSSMSVYSGAKDKIITAATPLEARGAYGESKLAAEIGLGELRGDGFKVAVLRPPMIFGRGCKGNFPRLVGLTERLPFFPNISNNRSMLHIDNLSEIVRLIIESGEEGVFFPQNPEFFCTSALAADIARIKGRKLRLTKLFNWAVYIAIPVLPPLKKLFGTLVYDRELSRHFDNQYQTLDNAASIEQSLE